MNKLAAAKPCAGCGHTEFTRDFLATAGDILCLGCGMVQVENPIVSEVQFGESSSGAATVQGAMVGADQARVYNMRNSLESREQTLMNAKSKVKLLAASMRIPDYIQESACGWFKLALVQNFVQGRRSQNVIAACLYVACRHEKTPHLLIDFSSRLQISVYSLGATYLKLVRALQIQRLPLADPSLFIQHFAERLNFAEYTAKVCRDATKIAQRMSSDWIYEGRRPAGIAGACLLLAARMNNFRRSHGEIMAVARVGEETLQKRLNEFKKTSSAQLSVLDFRESSDTNDSQPPSFQKNREIENKIEKLLRQRSHTLKKYRELAKRRQLYTHLNTIEKPGPAPAGEASAGTTGGNDLAVSVENAPNSSVDGNPTNDGQEQQDSMAHQTQETIEKSLEKVQSDVQEEVGSENSQAETQSKEILDDAQAKSTSEPETQPEPQTEASMEKLTEPLATTKASTQKETQKDSVPNVQDDTVQATSTGEKDNNTQNGTGLKEDEEEMNELFVPASDDEDYGYDGLPDNSELADADYDEHHEKILSMRQKSLRPSTIKASVGQPKKKTGRLGSITDSRAPGRLERASITKAARTTKTTKTKAKQKKNDSEAKKKEDIVDLKKLKEQKREEEREAREDVLLKAVLSGGDIKEEDLEIALDKILQGQTKSLDSSLYRTPADIQKETDLLKKLDLNRPRNLVLNNPTTRQVLSRVRDDETINTDDEDEEVLNVQLTDEERQQKERIWIALNHDFLIAQEKKRLKIEADELTGNTSGQSRKRRKVKDADPLLDDAAVTNAIYLIGEGGRMISPAENAKQMLQKKSFSRKINYSSIGDLFNEWGYPLLFYKNGCFFSYWTWNSSRTIY